MKKTLLLLPLFLLCISVQAQKLIQIEDKIFYLGAKVGVNSTFPIINSLTIDGVEAENIRLQYKVGYQASFFCRINIDRFFIQPDLTWSRKQGDVLFSLPQATESDQAAGSISETDRLQLKTT